MYYFNDDFEFPYISKFSHLISQSQLNVLLNSDLFQEKLLPLKLQKRNFLQPNVNMTIVSQTTLYFFYKISRLPEKSFKGHT